jgi:hypothetical protein
MDIAKNPSYSEFCTPSVRTLWILPQVLLCCISVCIVCGILYRERDRKEAPLNDSLDVCGNG